MKQLKIFLISLLVSFAGQAAQAALSSSLYLSDVCTNANCSDFSSSYDGMNNLTGQGAPTGDNWFGVIDKGTDSPYETFGGLGYLCDDPNNNCHINPSPDLAPYLEGNTGSLSALVHTEELAGSYYGMYDTFTAGASGFTGDVAMFGNLEWPQDGDSIAGSGCNAGAPTSALIVECDDTTGFNNRPAVAMVSGNNSWASSHITYFLDGWSPSYLINLNLTAGQAESIGFFVLLDATGNGPYTPQPSLAIADAQTLQSFGDFSWAGGQPVNFDSAVPEPGAMGLVSLFLVAGAIVLRRKAS